MQRFLKYFALSSLFLPIFTFAFTVPERPAFYVNDYASVLSLDSVNQLELKIIKF